MDDEAVARDALRYRWMRENPDMLTAVLVEFDGWQHEFRTPEKFDEEVDAAMKNPNYPLPA